MAYRRTAQPLVAAAVEVVGPRMAVVGVVAGAAAAAAAMRRRTASWTWRR
jgi:hypothetical protein